MPCFSTQGLHKGELYSFCIESAGDDDGLHLISHRLTLPDLMVLEGFDGAHHRFFYGNALDA